MGGSMGRPRRNKWEAESSQKLILQWSGMEKGQEPPQHEHILVAGITLCGMGALCSSQMLLLQLSSSAVFPGKGEQGYGGVLGLIWPQMWCSAWKCRISPEPGHTETSLVLDTGNAHICNPSLQHFECGHIPACLAWGGVKQRGHETNSRKLSEYWL